jgi:hypothetical protein
MKRWTAIAFLLLLGVGAYSQDSLSLALKRISTTGIFAFGGTGFAGRISKGETDFRVIMSQPSGVALDALERLYATGNPQAKSYALAGIRKLDNKRFQELRLSLLSSDEKVVTMHGCEISEQLLREVANDLNFGQYDHWLK